MSLKGQVALVTGGSRGIGKAIALDLAKKGADIAINYAGNRDAAIETAEEIKKLDVNAEVFQCDVSNTEEVSEMVKEIEKKLGKVAILVNNAGITRDTLFMRMKEEDWDKVIETNLKGVYNCSKAVIRGMMKQREGKIINITSVVGITGNAGQTNYSASKAGVIGFTKSLALELASRNVQVNAVAPGYIKTDMTDVIADEMKEEIIKKVPLGRIGQSEDVAHAVSFLASKEADYITGQVLSVNGGMYM